MVPKSLQFVIVFILSVASNTSLSANVNSGVVEVMVIKDALNCILEVFFFNGKKNLSGFQYK